MRYQDIYPSDALLRSFDVVRPPASELLNLEYFEAEPAGMPTARFEQHHLLLNLQPNAHRVENWRDGKHRDFTYRQHEIVLTPAGMESGWRWHSQSRVIVVTLDPARLRRFAESELGMILTDRQVRDVPQAPDEELCRSGMMLLDALRNRGTGSQVIYEALARVFLVQLLQRYGEARAAAREFGRGLSLSQHRRVLDHVAARFGGAVTIEDMARVAGMSPAHFARSFKATIGDTPYQFVMDYRMEQARKMLATRDLPLIDVALACGFADQPHFTRVFKRLTGQTPREYRGST